MTSSTSQSICAALVFVLAAACSGDSGARASNDLTSVGADSAGVRIVTVSNIEIAALDVWELGAPKAVIGARRNEPQYELNRVGMPRRLNNGGIVVPVEQHEFRIYDSTGVYRRTVGRFGLGPEEFQQLWSVHPTEHDSILALDISRDRVNVYSSSGDFVRQFPLDRLGMFPFGGKWMSNHTLVTGQNAAMHARRLDSDVATLAQDSMFVVLISEGTIARDTVAHIAGAWSHKDPTGTGGIPFYGSPLLATGMDGFVTAAIDAFEVRWHNRSGALLRVIRNPKMVNEIPLDSIAAFHARLIQRRNGRGAALESFPRRGPTVGGIAIDQLGRLWIKQWVPRSASLATWIVFDSTGAPRARIELPGSASFADADADHILVRQQDDMDVETVSLYSIVSRPLRRVQSR